MPQLATHGLLVRLSPRNHPGPEFGNEVFIKFADGFLNLMPSGSRRWTLYNLSWVLLALKGGFTITRTKDINNVEQLAYAIFNKETFCSAAMLAPRLQKSAWRVPRGTPSTATLMCHTGLPHQAQRGADLVA